MTLLGTAIKLAAEVHEHQTDKSDETYMLHSIAVMQAVAPDKDAMIVAVLHDALEDVEGFSGRLRVEHVIKTTFGRITFDAIWALTHKENEPYDMYIERVAKNYFATKVKIADLTHNMDPRRIPSYQIVDKDFQRWDKYRKALIRLERGLT